MNQVLSEDPFAAFIGLNWADVGKGSTYSWEQFYKTPVINDSQPKVMAYTRAFTLRLS